ncbi:Transposon Tf2-1 polyprotein [Salix suchowensis]|nr:Transposon Tf2-1 polyprotein [Salix suchowensis]
MVVYFSAYIPHYAHIASPLFSLLKKGVRWTWTAEHETSFINTRNTLAAAPVLRHPIQGSPYRLYTDTSDYALGASLQQVQMIKVAIYKERRHTIELRSWKKAYEQDVYYKDKGQEHSDASTLLTPSHFQHSGNGLMYLVDANWRYHLCIPKNKVNEMLNRIHNSPQEGAHSGERRFIARLCELFYWPRLVKDATDFMASCDVCQKIKVDRRGKQGGLRPSHIPARPFSTISMDMITGLPESGPEKFTAVLAFIDKLTKFAIIVPTYN